MTSKRNLFVYSTLIILHSGCASMSESECVTADWEMIGMEDGVKGNLPSNIGLYRSACADHGITPNLAAYRNGHSKGLVHFCTKPRGFTLGQRGTAYNGVCPTDLAESFIDGYQAGRKLFNARSEVNHEASQIAIKKKQLKTLKDDIYKGGELLISENTSAIQRIQILDKIINNQKQIGGLEDEILDIEKRKKVKEKNYQELKKRYDYSNL